MFGLFGGKAAKPARAARSRFSAESLENRSLMSAAPWGMAAAAMLGGAAPAAETAPPDGGKITLISEVQKQNLAKLKADLQAIRDGSNVTDEMRAQLRLDIKAALDGATRPDPALVDQFIVDFKAAAQDGVFTTQERTTLRRDVNAILISANVSQEEIQALRQSARTIVEASGVTRETLQGIRSDVQAIVTEFRANHPRSK